MNLDFALEVTSVDEAGSFQGLASTYGSIDRVPDIVMPGAFTKSLLKNGNEIPVHWAHDLSQPIALGTLTDSPAGLAIKGELDLDTQAGREAHSRLRKKICRALSIGFQIPEGGAEFKDGIRRLKQIDLLEVSLVSVPCERPGAYHQHQIGRADLRSFEKFLHEAGFSRSESKRLAMHGFNGLCAADEGDDDTELLRWLQKQNAA
jgi:HK97 family phage prohead protease